MSTNISKLFIGGGWIKGGVEMLNVFFKSKFIYTKGP